MAPFDADAPLLDKMKHGYDPMIEGVRWSERCADRLERMWDKLPGFVGRTLATTAIFMLGSSVQGESVHRNAISRKLNGAPKTVTVFLLLLLYC